LIAAERAALDWEAGLAHLGDEPAVIPAIVYAELLVGPRDERHFRRVTGLRCERLRL
jgi:hypothetical protein